MIARLFSLVLVGSALLSLATGCSSGVKANTSKVQGIVKLDGMPVEGATVSFIPKAADGHLANGLTGSDGVFTLTTYNTGDGALPGEYTVTVVKTATKSVGDGGPDIASMDQKDRAKAMASMMASQAKQKNTEAKSKKREELPSVYADPTKSPLKATVPVSNRVELDLKKSGGS